MNKLLIIFFLLFPAMNSSQKKGNTKKDYVQKEMHVFLLMGQSNMSGFGELFPTDSIPVENVFIIPTITKDTFYWKQASHPLHNRLPSDRFGLGLSFATEYLKSNPNVQVGLIPVAWGGAGIDQINKGTATFQDAIKKVQFASHNGTIKGVLWHQGESDMVTEELANSYEHKLHKLINDLRIELGISDLPFIVGNLAEFYGTGEEHNSRKRVEQIKTVKKALHDLPSKIQYTGFVESTGYKSIDNHFVHFNRESYIILGERYANKLMEINSNQ
jgi:hypothetical protein